MTLSPNRTEVDQWLPGSRAVWAARLMDAVARYPLDAAHDVYDRVLEEAGVVVSDVAYPHVMARLHTIACTECPRLQWNRRRQGWEWRRGAARAAADVEDDADDADEV